MNPGKIACFWVLCLIFIQLRGISTVSVKETFLKKIQKDNVRFCPDFIIGNDTLFVKWNFHSKKNLHLLTKWLGKSHTQWIIPQEEYKGRLSAPEGMCLEIMNLTLKDSGCYESHISSISGKIYVEKFNLTVLDAVTANNNTSEYLRQEFLLSILLSVLVILWVV
ncbi:uncharacterized protein ACOB8E_025017 [Sarcophilus harrisii]